MPRPTRTCPRARVERLRSDLELVSCPLEVLSIRGANLGKIFARDRIATTTAQARQTLRRKTQFDNHLRRASERQRALRVGSQKGYIGTFPEGRIGPVLSPVSGLAAAAGVAP